VKSFGHSFGHWPRSVPRSANRAATWLDPDPRTAGQVRRIFAERLKFRSVAGIASELNETGIACASGTYVNRNQHRHGDVWAEPTVASIPANPRHTGYQVWNRQPTDRTNVPAPAAASGRLSAHKHEYGRLPMQRWGSAHGCWGVSRIASHPALVRPRSSSLSRPSTRSAPTGTGTGVSPGQSEALVTALREHHVVIDCTVQDCRRSIAKAGNGPRL